MNHREKSPAKLCSMSDKPSGCTSREVMSGDIGQSETTSSWLPCTATRDLVQVVILLLIEADYEILEKTACMCLVHELV